MRENRTRPKETPFLKRDDPFSSKWAQTDILSTEALENEGEFRSTPKSIPELRESLADEN